MAAWPDHPRPLASGEWAALRDFRGQPAGPALQAVWPLPLALWGPEEEEVLGLRAARHSIPAHREVQAGHSSTRRTAQAGAVVERERPRPRHAARALGVTTVAVVVGAASMPAR